MFGNKILGLAHALRESGGGFGMRKHPPMNTATRTVVCPHCQAKLRTAASPEKQVRCPKCQAQFRPTPTQASPSEARVICSACQTKLKGIKPGARFKCPKCGSIERAVPASEQPLATAKTKSLKAPASQPVAKPMPAQKPTPKPMKSATKAETRRISDSTDEELEVPDWEPKPEPVPRPTPKTTPSPTPNKASTATSSSRSRHRDDDDDESSWRISGKLLATLITLVLIGSIVGAWSLFGGDSGPDRGGIEGEVTLDGTPVAVGTIHFSPFDAKGKPIAVRSVKIEGGRYKTARAQGPSVGMCRVEIRVQKKTGQQTQKFMGAPGELEDEIVEGAADRFNAKSELTFDVKAGANTKNFEVSAR